MSGPKGFGYRVRSEAERRRREDEARSGRCDQHLRTLVDLVAQLRRLGAAPSRLLDKPTPITHGSLIAREKELQRAVRDTQVQLRDEVAKELRRRLRKEAVDEVGRWIDDDAAKQIGRRLKETKDAVDVSSVSLGGPAVPAPAASAPSIRSSELARVWADVDKVIALLARVRDAPVRDELARMAERMLGTTSPAQAAGDLLTLKTQVSNVLGVQECRDLAEQAVLRIAQIITPEADALRARAAAVSSMKGVHEVQTGVGRLADAAERAADAEYVKTALEDALKELGFGIGEGFELSDFGRSVVVADHPEHAGYGVRVQLNPDNGMIYTRVVSKRDTSPEDDVLAEKETCAKVQALADGLKLHGVAAELKSERQPGEVPVERYGAKPAGTTRKRPRARATQQVRSTR